MSEQATEQADFPDDPILMAAVALIGRTGATQFQLRYSDDEQPVVWMAVAGYQRDGADRYQVGSGLAPREAVFSLCEALVDGGMCTHCQRPTGVSDEFDSTMPLDEHICWYQYDPELKTFRRGCESA